MYLKVEGPEEPYPDITPPFGLKRRLKIGTFKVELNGFKLGERFLKIIFDNAVRQMVDEIYVTIFANTIEQIRLIKLLEDFGFIIHGLKTGGFGQERVYVRSMLPAFNAVDPKLTFPFVSRSASAFLVPIKPEYHTSLLPDSILKTERPAAYVDHEPHRNSIRKVYVSRSQFRDLRRGDTLVFYRTGGRYISVATTLGIVEEVHDRIANEEHFIRLCRKRSVFSDSELRKWWNEKMYNRPFITAFLYAYSFPKRPTLQDLIDHGVIRNLDSAPRGFEQITPDQFVKILSLSKTDERIIVN